jgi:NAD(P)H-flavin reductase
VLAALAERERYEQVRVLYGAREPSELLYPELLEEWRPDVDIEVTVDAAGPEWPGPVGFVAKLVSRAELRSQRTTAFVCGPEIMMRLSARALADAGVPARQIRVSLERNMRCGVARCGHCQLGPLLVCRDGPVVSYAEAAPLVAIKEL